MVVMMPANASFMIWPAMIAGFFSMILVLYYRVERIFSQVAFKLASKQKLHLHVHLAVHGDGVADSEMFGSME